MNVKTKYRVIAGPYRVAKRYAESRNWRDDEVVIVTRGHQLAKLNPADIAAIVTVKLHVLGARVADEITDETHRIQSLWPVRVLAAA